jgi:uncharacterized membrane protein
MAVDVSTEVVVARPRAEVAAFAVDPERIPLWYTHIKSLEWRTEPPLAIGTRLAFVAQFLRRRLEYTYEVVEHVPGERFVMRSTEGSFPMETTYRCADAGEGRTTMTMRNRGQPSGLFAVLGPLIALAMRRAMARDLALLKAILEARSKRRTAGPLAAAPGA